MRRYTAEGIGTFAVMFLGCSTALVGARVFGVAGVATAFGLALAAVSLAIGPISGAHCNPAVSLGMALTGRLPLRDLLPYATAQLAGGAAGSALAVTLAGGRPGGDPLAAEAIANGFDRLSPGYYGLSGALIAEVTLTALFVFVLLGVTPRPWRAPAGDAAPGEARLSLVGEARAASPVLVPLASGITYTLIHLVGLPVTKLAANPARALGPALLAGGKALDQLWVFLLAPLVGALLAVLAHRLLRAPSAPPLGGEPARSARSAAA